MILLSRDEKVTVQIAEALGQYLLPGDTVLLYGELGAGKSVFARGCARALGVKGEMASPSFTLMQNYRGDRYSVNHFDLYRLSSPDELYYSGLEEQIGGDAVSLIEWPQQADVCPDRRIEVDIERGTDFESRRIELNLIGMDERKEEIFKALKRFEAEKKN